MAAIVGVTDIDPFVLNLAQGGTTGMSNGGLAAAILIATSSNNILKTFYAAVFAGGVPRPRQMASAAIAIRDCAGTQAVAFAIGDRKAVADLVARSHDRISLSSGKASMIVFHDRR